MYPASSSRSACVISILMTPICKFTSISTFTCIASNEGACREDADGEDDAEAEADDDDIEDDDDINDDGIRRGGGICLGRLGLVRCLSKGAFQRETILPSSPQSSLILIQAF